MIDNHIPLPSWIQSRGKKYYVPKSMSPLQCTNCMIEWYPRIKQDGEIILPGTCPNSHCRTKAYRKKR